MAKTSQQVIVSIEEKQDIVALAVVTQESQAEVTRQLIRAAMPAAKRARREALTKLRKALNGFDNVPDIGEALMEMATVRTRADGTRRTLTLADLETDRFPWPASRGTSAKPAA